MSGKPPLSSQRLREIAHELRSPLGGIAAMVEMLAASGIDARQKRIVDALDASLTHLREIADMILDSPKPEVGRRADPHHFLANLELACEARARAKGLEFRLELAEPDLMTTCEGSTELRQVLENLLDNAFRLTSKGGIRLSVARYGEGRVRFSVTDSGPGLSGTDAARLVEQGGGIAGQAGGAGIGLRLAGRIVAERGGRLTGGPAPEGAGACFSFDWPATICGRGPHCLVVDDHPASRAVLVTILGAAGYGCTEAGGVEEALARIMTDTPAVVLTDLNMPNGGGASLIRKIAELPKKRRPRVIVVSADPVEASDSLWPMIDHAITKPITVRSVLAAVAGASNGNHRAA